MDLPANGAAASDRGSRAIIIEFCLIGQQMIMKNDNLVLIMEKILSNKPEKGGKFL